MTTVDLSWKLRAQKAESQLETLKKAFEFVCQERNEALKELEIVSRMSDKADARQISSQD